MVYSGRAGQLSDERVIKPGNGMVWTQPHSESVRVPRLSEVQVGGVESKQSQEVKLKGKAKCGRRAPSEEP